MLLELISHHLSAVNCIDIIPAQINYVLLSNGKWKKAQGPEAFLPLQSHLSFHLYVFHSPVIFLALVKLHPLAFCFHFQPKKYSKNFKFVFNFVPFDCVFVRGEGGGVCLCGGKGSLQSQGKFTFWTNFKVMVSTKVLLAKVKSQNELKFQTCRHSLSLPNDNCFQN